MCLHSYLKENTFKYFCLCMWRCVLNMLSSTYSMPDIFRLGLVSFPNVLLLIFFSALFPQPPPIYSLLAFSLGLRVRLIILCVIKKNVLNVRSFISCFLRKHSKNESTFTAAATSSAPSHFLRNITFSLSPYSSKLLPFIKCFWSAKFGPSASVSGVFLTSLVASS